jgi:hypothetical protein
MDALNYLRKQIKTYFPESSELILSSSFATHPRFNFYFEIKPGERFLLYLNWDGDDLRYTLKCLEFRDWEVLKRLIDAYPTIGSKAFNIGQPRALISFLYRDDDRLAALQHKGSINGSVDSEEIIGAQLMHGLDPFQ